MGLQLYETQVESRLLLGSSRYPSPAILLKTIQESRTEIVTVSLRRESGSDRSGQAFWSLIGEAGVRVLPNTAGCHGVKEAVTTAHMAREIFNTTWIKLEVIGENDTLAPDVFGTVEAARILCSEGFEVFPYTTDDLVVADKLVNAGCRVLMPLGAPIGSAQGLNNPAALRRMRGHFPDIPLIVDAGIGLPSHATSVMEMGYDAVLLNSAVALAGDPVLMGRAFALAIESGNLAYRSDALEERDMASPSTPVLGKAWLD